MDAERRNQKARKIAAILATRTDLAQSDVLDLGAGSGDISAHFQDVARSVTAADRDTAPFRPEQVPVHRIEEAGLPFPAASFDVVIFNHVIEHVGEPPEQLQTLKDIRRVMRPSGLLYLAAPSRWAIIEPHYRLPFLSWLPRTLADRAVRACGRGTWYDCVPHGNARLRSFLRQADFEVEDVTVEALLHLLRIEHGGRLAERVARRAPHSLLRTIVPAMPTFVLIGRRARSRLTPRADDP